MSPASLPIHAVLPTLLAALRAHNAAVLIAPPGAGKTTAVPLALLAEPWCTGTVILLSPRRIAARAAAERMAETLGEEVGRTVGYLTRLDSRRSPGTRLRVVTEAIFVATIVADPELAGASAVLFDEAHERHLDSDLGLALAIETAQVLRPELRLLVMSATISGSRFADLLGAGGRPSPTIASSGADYPLSVEWLGSSPELRIEEAVAAAVARAWRDEPGDVLAFLPGVREIERTATLLAERLPQALVLPLHGQVEPAGQRAAIRRHEQRRIVLATAIAETSLTLDGVAVVVDSGVARRAEFDPAAGHARLVTVIASQAAATQRAGRAARQGPGVVYRLWSQAAHGGRPAFDPPEMLTADLAGLRLTLAQWGESDPRRPAWLDSPPSAAWAAAGERLEALGALDGSGRITDHGRLLTRLPMEPGPANMLLWSIDHGAAETAARLVLLLQERALGGRGEDLEQRLRRWRSDRGGRAQASLGLAKRWAAMAGKLRRPPAKRAAEEGSSQGEVPLGVLIAAAFPSNLARRRDPSGEHWLAAGGRGFRLDPISPLARAEWLAIGDAQGEARGARILAAAALASSEVEAWLGDRIVVAHEVRWNHTEQRVEARRQRRLGAIVLSSEPDPAPDTAAIAAVLLARACERLADFLPADLLARVSFAGLSNLSASAFDATADEWLGPLLAGRRDLALNPGEIADAALMRLSWDERQQLDRLAPTHFRSPAGTSHPIDYTAPAGPTVELRVQALFGLDAHPAIGEPPHPLLLSLTSPAGRPLQTTADLPAFWRGSWADVRREMKGRYPRHRWPEEPWREAPSLKTRNAFEASRT